MDVLAIDPGTGSAVGNSTQSALPVGAISIPASQDPTRKPLRSGDETLHQALSQLVGSGSKVSISFRVVHGPNEIVTVFTNSETGELISEFPPEAMVLIAQFFNKLAGAVLDRTA